MDNQLPHPASTRMLLRSEGSTTQLLESLLDETLSVSVVQQRKVPPRSVAPFIVRHLSAERDGLLLERRSMLLTPAGEWVSRNYVICRLGGSNPILDELKRGRLPIGKLWQQRQLSGHRSLLGYGRMLRAGGRRPSIVPYKHYVQWHEDAPLMYIREQFNPKYVGLDGPSADAK